MEIHAHTHTARKKWTHYFWEFLMLFLAVFCGFLAEYMLEHKIESDRADEYAELFLEDLKHDADYISQLQASHQNMILHEDSLLAILTGDQYTERNYEVVDHFNKLAIYIDFNPAFPVNFEQAKNSGSLRYIKNRQLTSSLSSLSREMQIIQEVCKGYNDHIKQYLTPFSVEHFNTLQYDIFSRRVLADKPDIYKWNREAALALINKVNLKKTYDLFFVNHFFPKCYENINTMAESIRKEFHLK